MDKKPEFRKQAAKLFRNEFKENPYTDFSELSFKQILEVDGIDSDNLEKALENFCNEHGFKYTIAREPHCNEGTIRFYPKTDNS